MHPGPFHRFSAAAAHGAGTPLAFALACLAVALWAVTGPIFGFSEVWQLVINTATTIITFLMIFIVQHTQNRDGMAVQAKLDELILAVRDADNRLIGAEDLTGEELGALRKIIAQQAKKGAEEAIREELEG
jgi:low affinity Fe/Cu permease